MRVFKNGQVFGRLTIVNAYSYLTKYKHWKHECKCQCGSIKLCLGVHLRKGRVLSCGCLSSESTSKRLTTHGMTGTSTYKIWKSIKGRCLNKKDKAYPKYGGAGIGICDTWRNSFERFLSDMGKRPDGLSIDRIDGLRGYSKENCRWATSTIQARNTKLRGNSKAKGISILPSGRYRAVITNNYKTLHLGVFDTEKEAISVRLKAEDKFWGNER